MFTGLVEEVGKIKKIEMRGDWGRVEITASKVLEGTVVGDSIAVNGICLTVTDLREDSFCADIMAETVRRSSLKQAVSGSLVNLERAMAADGRFGGHIVSGHIDGTGIISSIRNEGNAVWIWIRCADEILSLIVEKGSICIDGISLTVASLAADSFAVSVIPHTREETALSKKIVGDVVNLENDIIGKYVQRLLGSGNKRSSDERLMELLENSEY